MRSLQFESVAFIGALAFLVVGASLALFAAGGRRARSTRMLVAGAILLASSGAPELVDWATNEAAWFWSYVAVTLLLWGGAFLAMGFRLIHESDCRPRKTVLFASSLTLLLWMDLLIQGYMLGYRSAIVMVGLFFMAAPLVKAPRNADSGTAEMVAFRISMLVVASISSIRAVAGLLDPVRDAFLSSSLDAWLILVLDLSTLMAFGLAAIPPARGRAPTDAMKAADRGTLETVPGRVSLSPRESEYVHEIIMGSSPKEIAGAHGVSHSTVRNTLSRAYKKLGVRDCGELLVLGSGIRARR